MRRAVGLVVVAAVVGAAPLAAADQRDPIEEARQAAQHTPFAGVVSLQWRDGTVMRTEQVRVEGADGSFVVEGRRVAMARGGERFLQDSGGGWELLWPSSATPSGHPAASAEYQFRTGPKAVVAGHAAHVVEVRKDGVVRERLYLDDASGLLLRREQFGEDGSLERILGFDRITIQETSVTAPPPPQSVTRDVPKALSGDGLPAALAAGYRRLGAYRSGGVLHVLYNDGFSDLSLFEQRGRLDHDQLPARAQPLTTAGLRGWSFVWPGGEAVVWTAGRTVYTLMGDVPADELVRVARSVPAAGSPSVGHRLRQACRSLVEAFSGDI